MEVKRPYQLFLDDGSCIYGDELKFIGHGYNADVWKWQHDGCDFAVKTFYPNCYGLALHQDIASIFSQIQFYNLPNLYSTVCHHSFSFRSIDGYVMEFFEEEKGVSLMDISSTNLFSSISYLEDDMQAFSSYQVMMNDIRKDNTMITRDGMLHLFDYDMFYVDSDMNSKYVMLKNQHMVLWLLGNLFSSSLLFDFSFSTEEKKKLNDWLKKTFSLRRNGKRLPSEVIEEFFVEDTPRDSLKKLVRR